MADDKKEDITKITNIQERRRLLIPYYANICGQPYNQYITKRNKEILEACCYPLFDASMIGYEYQDCWETQEGVEREASIMRLFKISRNFNGITLTDEELNIVAYFANAIRIINANDISSIAKTIEDLITDQFAIFASARNITYILCANKNVLEALIYYKLLPTSIMATANVILIPEELKGNKLWFWDIVPEGGYTYWGPSIGAPFVYTGEDGDEYNPLWVLPEWCFVIEDN